MKIAVVFCSPSVEGPAAQTRSTGRRLTAPPPRYGNDPGVFAAGFRALGHDAAVVTQLDGNLDDPAYWRNGGFDIALVYTWMTAFTSIVAALKASGTFVIQKGDTDGMLGARVFPRARLERMVMPQRRFVDKARALGFWVRTWMWGFRGEDAEAIANFRLADLTIVESEGARLNLARFLRFHGESALETKMAAVPNPVDESLWRDHISKERLIVSVGRWDDPQKDAALLVHVLGTYLRKNPTARAEAIGLGGDVVFAPLSGFANFRYVGAVPHAMVSAHLAAARIILFTSRWEGLSIALCEALTLGCTAVTTPLPTFEHIVGQKYGVVAASRAGVEAALETEMRAWDEGRRDPEASAAHFRALLAPRAVAARILEFARSARSASA